MRNQSKEIHELLDLEDIEENEIKYYKKYGYSPFNISTWNPSKYFSQTYLKNHIQLNPFDYIPYLYSYEMDSKQIFTTKKNLGGNNNFGCLITNTGTSAITLVTSVLKEINIKRILIICPVYYAVLYNFIQKGMQVFKLYVNRMDDGYRLPQLEITKILDNIDAIWLTNPVYNTGIYLSKNDIEFLRLRIPSRIMLICDDCFTSNGQELIRNFDNSTNFISIHDPLKQIMINGLKFACVLYPLQYESLFEQWSDIICGSLSYSTVQSVDFFNSDSFFIINDQLKGHFKDMNTNLQKLVENFPKISIDKQLINSHMHMCTISHLPYDFLQDISKMYLFMEHTGTSLIPGNRFHYPNSLGFSFRINFGRECIEFWDALIRIFQYLS